MLTVPWTIVEVVEPIVRAILGLGGVGCSAKTDGRDAKTNIRQEDGFTRKVLRKVIASKPCLRFRKKKCGDDQPCFPKSNSLLLTLTMTVFDWQYGICWNLWSAERWRHFWCSIPCVSARQETRKTPPIKDDSREGSWCLRSSAC